MAFKKQPGKRFLQCRYSFFLPLSVFLATANPKEEFSSLSFQNPFCFHSFAIHLSNILFKNITLLSTTGINRFENKHSKSPKAPGLGAGGCGHSSAP